jgi:hypothetical protein
MPLNDEQLRTLLEVAEKAAKITPGPWSYVSGYVRHKNATDRSGRAKPYTLCSISSPGANELRTPEGKYGTFDEARTVQRARGEHVAAFDPSTCAELVREVLAAKSEIGRLREQLKETQAAAEKWYHERY